MNDGNKTTSAASWDTYWQGSKDGALFGMEGANHPLVPAYWERFFSSLADSTRTTKIIGIASGSGTVIACITEVFQESEAEITSLDVSTAAIERITERYPDVRGIVADAARSPSDIGVYDIVTSQFGVDAIPGIGRLVAPGGRIALVLHHRDGTIYKERAGHSAGRRHSSRLW